MKAPATRAVMAETILVAVTDARRPVSPSDPRFQALAARPAKQLAKSYAMALRLLAARRRVEAEGDGA